MKTSGHSPLHLIRRALLPAVGLLIIANFVGYAVAGSNGILSWGDYRRLKQERSIQLAQLKEHQAVLAHRAHLLDPGKADPDLADEIGYDQQADRGQQRALDQMQGIMAAGFHEEHRISKVAGNQARLRLKASRPAYFAVEPSSSSILIS